METNLLYPSESRIIIPRPEQVASITGFSNIQRKYPYDIRKLNRFLETEYTDLPSKYAWVLDEDIRWLVETPTGTKQMVNRVPVDGRYWFCLLEAVTEEQMWQRVNSSPVLFNVDFHPVFFNGIPCVCPKGQKPTKQVSREAMQAIRKNIKEFRPKSEQDIKTAEQASREKTWKSMDDMVRDKIQLSRIAPVSYNSSVETDKMSKALGDSPGK